MHHHSSHPMYGCMYAWIIGHMRFIGELYKKDLISAGTIKQSCLDRLIQSSVEEELTCMCKLFQTIGAKLENYYMEKSKQKRSKLKNCQNIFPDYFDQIQALAKNHPSSRVRFMLYDLVAMRNNNWTARREGEKMVSLNDKNHPPSSSAASAATATHAATTGSTTGSNAAAATASSNATTATSGSTIEPVVVPPVAVVVAVEPAVVVVPEADEWNQVRTALYVYDDFTTTATSTATIASNYCYYYYFYYLYCLYYYCYYFPHHHHHHQ